MAASEEWLNYQVKCYIYMVKKRQLSIRKKNWIHKTSEYHKRAESIVNEKEANLLPNVVVKQQQHLHDSTARAFRTVYKQVSLNRSL
jgi:hypothetical protein